MADERIYPHGENINFTRHVARYEFARSLIEKDTGAGGILDFMCGCGYGSDILTQTKRAVVGFDKDIEAINYAQRYYTKPTFLLCDWKAFEKHFANRTFLYVICLEAIEHIAVDDTEKFMAAIAGLLQDDGKLIVSTPCYYENGFNALNPFHTNTFKPDRYKKTLCDAFKTVKFFKQDDIDTIYPIDEPQLGFTIGVCSDARV